MFNSCYGKIQLPVMTLGSGARAFQGNGIRSALSEIWRIRIGRPVFGSRRWAYKNRWAVECLFADAKTRGFNMEDTRMTAPDKIDTLTAILAIAVTWAYRCATQTMGMRAIRRKAHGRREKSWFRTGLDALRAWITFAPENALQAWQDEFPKRLKKL